MKEEQRAQKNLVDIGKKQTFGNEKLSRDLSESTEGLLAGDETLASITAKKEQKSTDLARRLLHIAGTKTLRKELLAACRELPLYNNVGPRVCKQFHKIIESRKRERFSAVQGQNELKMFGQNGEVLGADNRNGREKE